MALSVENEEAARLARELARLTGESLTEVVVVSLRERLERKRAEQPQEDLFAAVMAIARDCAALPLLDPRSPDEILYDEQGLPR